MTYRGHRVYRTLIRCHFSPIASTGAQYIYSGSADGKIHVGSPCFGHLFIVKYWLFQIWSLDGRIVQVLDRSKTLPITYDPSAPDVKPTRRTHQYSCVRDVSWHSQVLFLRLHQNCPYYVLTVCQEPVLISAAWSSAEGGSHIARHEWKGLSKMSGQLEDWVQKQQQEEPEMNRRRRSARLAHRAFLQNMPGAFNADEDA